MAAQNGILAAAAQSYVSGAVAGAAHAQSLVTASRQREYLAQARRAYDRGDAAIALSWLGYLDATNPQGSVASSEQPLKGEVTVAYSHQLIGEGRSGDAVPLLRAVLSQTAAAGDLYPKALLAAGK